MLRTPDEEFERSERVFFDHTLDFQGQNVMRTDTPETMLTEYPLRPAPDISLICEQCKVHIPLIQLKEHRAFHAALTVLKYGAEEPKNSDVLLKRRNLVLRRMKAAATKDDKPVTPQQIQHVNDAYEYLKALLDGNFVDLRQVREDVNAHVGGVALNCSPECIQAVGMAASSNERWKSYMEDARSFQDYFGDDKHKSFFGLYDGYHGRFAAEVAASELHKLLLSEMTKFDPRTKMVISTNPLGEADISHYKFERPDTCHSERVMLYDESVGIIQNIINLCEDKYNELVKKLDESPREQSEADETMEDPNTQEPNTARKKKKQKTPFESKMESAFSKAYYYLDILLSYGKDENSKIRWSGCSATTCVIQDVLAEEKSEDSKDDRDGESVVSSQAGHLDPPKVVGNIHLANSGDVRGVLVRGNRAYTLTKDHTPNNKKEKSRVLKDGGTLTESSKDCQVNGVLLTTRGLGNHGDKTLKKCVIVEPHTMHAPIDQYAQFLVLATRGVWQVFTEKEATSLLIKLLPCNQIPPPCKVNSTLHPLFDEMNRPISQDSRKVSFSSRDSPSLRKSSDNMNTERRRSGTLQSVAESQLEDTSSKSGQGSNVDSSKGQGHSKNMDNSGESEKAENSKGQSSGTGGEINGKSSRSASGEGQRSDVNSSSPGQKSSEEGSSNRNQSTPTNQMSGNKRSRRYVDADMQTEVGSQNGDDDSGNEADIDSYLENVSFPGGISRISMVDGPPSREQMQRNLAQMMAQHLAQAALLAGAKDNISVMIILLPGSGL